MGHPVFEVKLNNIYKFLEDNPNWGEIRIDNHRIIQTGWKAKVSLNISYICQTQKYKGNLRTGLSMYKH